MYVPKYYYPNECRTYDKFSHNNGSDDAFPAGSSHPSRKMALARGGHVTSACVSPCIRSNVFIGNDQK